MIAAIDERERPRVDARRSPTRRRTLKITAPAQTGVVIRQSMRAAALEEERAENAGEDEGEERGRGRGVDCEPAEIGERRDQQDAAHADRRR